MLRMREPECLSLDETMSLQSLQKKSCLLETADEWLFEVILAQCRPAGELDIRCNIYRGYTVYQKIGAFWLGYFNR